MKLYIPIRLPSLANVRMHWRALDRLKKSQKGSVQAHLRCLGITLPSLPATITLTRIGKRKLDDDNLAAAFKYVRDQIAAAYGVDDGSELYAWRYQQRTGKVYGVEIEVTPGSLP